MASTQPQNPGSSRPTDSDAFRAIQLSQRLTETRKNTDLRLLSEWLRWIVVGLFALSTFYLRTTYVSRETYLADREADRESLSKLRAEDQKRTELLEQDRSLRLERINTSIQDLSLSIRTVQADKTPAYLTERIISLERELSATRNVLQELAGAVAVLKQVHAKETAR